MDNVSGRKEKRNIKKATVKSSKKNNPKRVSIFTVAFILVLIAVLVGVYYGIRYIIITLKYREYTEKMVDYGFNELYYNSNFRTSQ